ncbi:MAG: molecular chaperone TorD family protein [Halanaeroarchaeum sp.]
MTSTDTPPTEPRIADEAAAARATIYGILARLFEEPDEGLYEALADGSLAAELDVLVERAGLDVAVPTVVTDDGYDLLCARFNDVFAVGYPDPPVPLYESEHVTEGAWNDVNLDVARAYDYFGVAVDETEREHHDHLVLELEFAGYLARLAAATNDAGARRARRDFLDRHLAGFLENVADEVAGENETGVYEPVAEFAAGVAHADLAALEGDGEVADG